MSSALQARYDSVHREMIDLFEQTAARENHWLMYLLLAWENMIACAVSYFLVEVEGVQARWPYVVVWLAQIAVALVTIRILVGPPPSYISPLETKCKRVWTMFVFLSINVAVLNVLVGQPVFVFLPALAALSSMAFTAMTVLLSRKFMTAGLFMFAVGIVMANFPQYGFLIYGAGWLVVLHVIGGVFLLKRKHWLMIEETKPAKLEPQDGQLALSTRT